MEVEKMELRLINPNESGFLQHIEWNAEEIRSQVESMISAYTDVAYTDETMKSAKDDRATLNKLKKAIEDRRKEVKKKCMEPYEQFEKEVKDIVTLIDKPIQMIDGQIKDYEEQQKAEKKVQIQAAYDETIGDLAQTLPFDKVFDTRYLNATYALSKAISEVKEKIEKVRTDLATIDGLDSKYRLNVKDVYIQTFDLSKAMAEDRRLKELEQRLEAERKAKEEAELRRQQEEDAKREEMERRKAEIEAERLKAEAEKAAAEIQESAETSQTSKPVSEMGKVIQSIEQQGFVQATQVQTEQEPQEPQQTEPAQEQPKLEEKRYKATYWCKGTLDQIKALGNYMRANNIEFGKVAK